MTEEQEIQAVAVVAAGLLASGHYTMKAYSASGPEVLEKHIGKDWREQGYSGWSETHAVREAIIIVHEIRRTLAFEKTIVEAAQ